MAERLYKIKFKNFKSFCQKNNYPVLLKPELPIDNFRKYGLERIALVLNYSKKNETLENLTKWTVTKAECHEKKLKKLKKTDKFYLEFGDAGKNILANEDNIFMIDWEFARFAYDFGGAYLWSHFFEKREKRKLFEKEYFRSFGGNKKEIEKLLNLNMSTIRLNEVIWSLMRFTETEDKKFLTEAAKRKKTYENNYPNQ